MLVSKEEGKLIVIFFHCSWKFCVAEGALYLGMQEEVPFPAIPSEFQKLESRKCHPAGSWEL